MAPSIVPEVGYELCLPRFRHYFSEKFTAPFFLFLRLPLRWTAVLAQALMT